MFDVHGSTKKKAFIFRLFDTWLGPGWSRLKNFVIRTLQSQRSNVAYHYHRTGNGHKVILTTNLPENYLHLLFSLGFIFRQQHYERLIKAPRIFGFYKIFLRKWIDPNGCICGIFFLFNYHTFPPKNLPPGLLSFLPLKFISLSYLHYKVCLERGHFIGQLSTNIWPREK